MIETMFDLTWAAVVRLADTGHFGDLVIDFENGNVSRGPIRTVRIVEASSTDIDDAAKVVINTIWRANEVGQNVWVNARQRSAEIVTSISISCVPKQSFDETVYVRVPGVGNVTLLSRTAPDGRLNPHNVAGLTSDEVRQTRAHEHGLPLYTTWQQILDATEDMEERIKLRCEVMQLAYAR